ncbi:MAG: hypothetical protein FRX49_08793 [Trebouxia sp. A1-2]|nr:MAG: hypothetical protein FRX49_08793 [Trebouxia sp. A1-2]
MGCIFTDVHNAGRLQAVDSTLDAILHVLSEVNCSRQVVAVQVLMGSVSVESVQADSARGCLWLTASVLVGSARVRSVLVPTAQMLVAWVKT